MLAPNAQLVAAFVDRFLSQHPHQHPHHHPARLITPGAILTEYFGDSPELADQLLEPILAGIKTATCSSLWEWEHDNESPPIVGTLCAIIDGAGRPRCVLETTQVMQMRFNQVDARFASDEGEGDRTLHYWRKAHWDFFTRTLPRIGKEPTQDMPLVCERFRMIYQEPIA